ncbi:MAG: hypothetical protein E4H13_11450 [Calditrichales bacterium]|nr:MAG: hypothetical protein E4H13_11450 [Calditrichales bacterium]
MKAGSIVKIYMKAIIAGTCLVSMAFSQALQYKIHNRGMLHETVYNSGDIGRPWTYGDAGNKTSNPLMEWPSRSSLTLNGINYSGQHNLLGAGIYMAANPDGKQGITNRIYALCGGVGAGSGSEQVIGQWSFPISMQEIENFPFLKDGSLNPDFNPDEAEEIIISSWATPLGVTVTRTSRAWSHPDFDDMIIYEYELEYTGDTDGNPATIERTETLKDFMALFIYGFAPSMYGFQRHYQEWKYDSGIYRGDLNGFWDADYWLGFNMNLRTNITDEMLWAKPEPDLNLFLEFASLGKNGGGLTSPQAPGVSILYYDTNYLAYIDTIESPKNESEVTKILRTSGGVYFELDENFHLKQPYSNKISTPNTRSEKMTVESINPDKRWSGVYSNGSSTWPNPPSPEWIGRAAYNYRQSVDAGQKHIVFGPYTLPHGAKLRFSLAEVVGYGAIPGKRLEGGQVAQQWAPTPSWNRKIVKDGVTYTEHYLTDFGYPDYINSDVITVQQVAHKALEAYLGTEVAWNGNNQRPLLGPVWPESNPPHGDYRIPTTFPAPVITVVNVGDGRVRVSWNREVEQFTHPRLSGTLLGFNVWRAESGMGPWELRTTINTGEVNTEEDIYEYYDDDVDFKVGEARYYAVTTVGDSVMESGKTNISNHQKNIIPVDKMSDVFVAPNPFYITSGYKSDEPGMENAIGFYGLPSRCTIRIYSYSGQLIETIEHKKEDYANTSWKGITRNGQEIASGIYLYVITTPDGDKKTGKFIVVK